MMSRDDAYTDSVDCARCNGEGIYNEETCFECLDVFGNRVFGYGPLVDVLGGVDEKSTDKQFAVFAVLDYLCRGVGYGCGAVFSPDRAADFVCRIGAVPLTRHLGQAFVE